MSRAIALITPLIFFVSVTPVVANGDLPEEFAIRFIPLDTDTQLGSRRVACAFGDMPDIRAEMQASGSPFPAVSEYCLSVLHESARRDLGAYLYFRMQPDAVMDEFDRVMAASGKSRDEYVNAAGATRELPCELAFDAGYAFGHWNPAVQVAPELADVEIDRWTQACFDPAQTLSSKHGLVAGARQAQRNLSKQ